MLQAWQNLNSADSLDSFVSLTTAFILGSVIGFERQYRQRTPAYEPMRWLPLRQHRLLISHHT